MKMEPRQKASVKLTERERLINAAYRSAASGARHYANRPGFNVPILPADPVERTVALALITAHVEFIMEGEDTEFLDFYLPAFNTYVECKRGFSSRTEAQMKRVENVIVIQGLDAAKAFAALVALW